MKFIHVVAGAIINDLGEVFIALRPKGKHVGGLWEFPGGKVELGEVAKDALARELYEELGIQVRAARPLITIKHHYPDKSVCLDVWCVTKFDGVPHGKEGQEVTWWPVSQLRQKAFPAANEAIIDALLLPECYLITPEPDPLECDAVFLAALDRALTTNNIRLIQFRAKSLPEEKYRNLAQQVIARCQQSGVKVLLNSPPSLALALGADGVHLSSDRLMAMVDRPLGAGLLCAASCHSADELAQAQKCGLDFVVLGAVQTTRSHPGRAALGWPQAERLISDAAVPVFALGGLSGDDLEQAWLCGAQGVAAISAFWDD